MQSESMSRLALRADGIFLAVAGGIAMIMDSVGHFRGVGPLSAMLDSPHSIGGFEAHGLALILGAMILRAASFAARRPWHLLGLVVHSFLGGSNLLFWTSFQQLDVIPVGIVTTVFHVAFVGLHAVLLSKSGR